MRRPPILPIVVGALAMAVYVWGMVDPPRPVEMFGAYRSGLYLEPWRAITSGFVHVLPPHLLFNLVTLWILGRLVVARSGTSWFVACFLSGLFVGQVVHTSLGPGYVYGISGGVCSLYGFLVRREWRGTLLATLRSRPIYWIYPLALIGLFVAELVGALPIANVNHVVGIAVGWLLAAGFGPDARRHWRAAAILTLATSLVLIVYRPWDPVWGAVRGRYDSSMVLPSRGCDESLGLPGPEVAVASPEVVTILGPGAGPLVVEYYDPDGRLIEVFRTAARARSFRPLAGSLWRISDPTGRCRTQFVADRSGVVLVP